MLAGLAISILLYAPPHGADCFVTDMAMKSDSSLKEIGLGRNSKTLRWVGCSASTAGFVYLDQKLEKRKGQKYLRIGHTLLMGAIIYNNARRIK